MKNKLISILIVFLLVVAGFLGFIIFEPEVVTASTTIYVGSGPGNDTTSIQDAIDNFANPGDTVFVYSGTYYENVIVNKTINLTGEDRDTTIIDGGGINNVVFINHVNYFNMSGFEVRNDSWGGVNSGIHLNSSSNININNNKIHDNEKGIILYLSSFINVQGNEIYNNADDGIGSQYSSNNTYVNNIIHNNNGTSSHGFFFSGTPYSNNKIIGNIVYNNKNDGIHLEDQSSVNGYTFWNNSIINNTIYNNGNNGIYIDLGTSNFIIGNIVYRNGFGNIINPGVGIRLFRSSKNRIYHNTFIDNYARGVQARDNTGTNFWNDSYPSGGNYWSDWTTPDSKSGPNQDLPGSDGIVDVPYYLEGGQDAKDYYPLTELNQNFIILYPGWNLISIPFIQDDQNLTKVLERIEGYYDAVQWYNTTDLNDPWKHYKVGKTFGNDLSLINETMGFWIHNNQTEEVIFLYNRTQPIVNQSISLHIGWNHVGYPSLTSHNKTTGLNNVDDRTDVDCIQWYEALTKTWLFMGQDDDFVSGRGYWIHSKVEKDWIVPL